MQIKELRKDAVSTCRPRLVQGGLMVMTAIAAASAQAVQIDTGSDAKVSWDNTVKYSAGSRLSDPMGSTLANPNTDDADRNFKKHSLITNRVDLLSEFDVRYKNFGLSISGAAWYDRVYNRPNDNDSPGTFNPFSVSNNSFTSDVRNLAGHHAEFRNAFVSGQFDLGEVPVSVRAGRHVVLWGESLFFSDNGIAAAMAPVDAFNAVSVPSIQAKEVFMPVNQLSTTAVLNDQLTLEGIYQFQWRRTRIMPAGTFFSPADLLDVGGERLIAGPGVYFHRGADATPDKKQFGLALKWRPKGIDTDFGFYALRYNEKTPQVYVTPGLTPGGVVINPGVVDLARGQIGTYQLGYQEGVQVYGISANTSVGETNLAAEVSYRRNGSLVSSGTAPLLPGMSINNSNPLYATGDTLHFQGSMIHVGKAGPFWDGFSFAGELAGHHLVKVRENEAARDTTRSKNALGVRGTLSFDYYQVAPGLDLTVPITVGWNFLGKSPITAAFNNYGGHHGGDISIGVNATYHQTWRGGINLTRFVGRAQDNFYRDRSFITANISTSF